MNEHERVAVIEALLLAPEATVGERLTALTMLRELEPQSDPISAAVQAIPTEQLDSELDAVLGPDIVRAVIGRTGAWPVVAGLIEHEIGTRAAELADATRIEQEIERRAEALADQLYRTRAFRSAVPLDVPADTPAGGNPTARVAVKPPPGIELSPASRSPRRRVARRGVGNVGT